MPSRAATLQNFSLPIETSITQELSSNQVPNPLQDKVFTEFRESAIPDRLTLANVTIATGEAAQEILLEDKISRLQSNTSYRTKPVVRLLERNSHLLDGMWYGYGCKLDGSRGEVVYAKPFQPRQYFDKGKLKAIKYETPEGCSASPILPYVDEETAQQIFKRYRVKPLEGETFWQTVQRCNVPVGITEGLKKALSMIAHGLPAIAVRGIGCWHPKGEAELYSIISDFATPGRRNTSYSIHYTKLYDVVVA